MRITIAKSIPDLFFSLLFGLVIMLVISMIECGCSLIDIPVQWLLFTLLLSASLYILNHRVAIWIQHYFENRFHRFLVYLLINPALTAITLFIIRYLIFGTKTQYNPILFFQLESSGTYIFGAAVSIVTGGSFYAINAIKAMKDEQIEKEKAKSSLSEAKFINLKNQIDPHFLFNSLNVLSGLIEEDAEKAFRYTNSLSSLYRNVLTQKDKELVPIAEELQLCKEYLYLLQIRFEDALNYIISADLEQKQSVVVPLCLQLLLENAIKHNEASDLHPLLIRMYSKDGYLIVENNLQPRKSFVESNNTGLAIITERYKSYSKLPVIVESDKYIFRVALPLILNPQTP